jgi:ribosomal protein S18 acetylase RimI-like enzyme
MKHLTELEDNEIQKQIFDLLVECDDEFTPALRCRTKIDGNFSTPDNISNYGSSLPTQYFDNLVSRCEFIVDFDDEERVRAFTAFIPPLVTADFQNIDYVVALTIVSPKYRGQGIAGHLISFLQTHALLRSEGAFRITRRVRATNDAMIKVLNRYGYTEFNRVENELGQGIDTIYFEKSVYRGDYL